MESRVLETAYLGRVAYAEGLRLQEERWQGIRESGLADALFLLEHDPVLTLGRNARRENILADDAALARLGIAVHECGRGGDVTYHGPGQLVGYPVLNLAPDHKDVGKYVRGLEEAILRTLAEYGVAARRFPKHTGVWVEGEKIAAIGVRLSRWITTHGFALNISTNLDHFKTIVPCGIKSHGVTSMAKLGVHAELPEVGERVAHHLAELFGRELEWNQEIAATATVASAGKDTA